MTLDEAIYKATLFYGLAGTKVISKRKKKIKKISRITAYRRDNNEWDVAIFFERTITLRSINPNCFLKDFLEKYDQAKE